MKYYCKNCGSEFKFGPDYEDSFADGYCPFCVKKMIIIPDYETPQQYEKRTGEKLNPRTSVWFRILDLVDEIFNDWTLLYYADALQYEREAEEADNIPTVYIVIADLPVPPSAYWKPEVVA